MQVGASGQEYEVPKSDSNPPGIYSNKRLSLDPFTATSTEVCRVRSLDRVQLDMGRIRKEYLEGVGYRFGPGGGGKLCPLLLVHSDTDYAARGRGGGRRFGIFQGGRRIPSILVSAIIFHAPHKYQPVPCPSHGEAVIIIVPTVSS